ncbi:hypothetical protein L0657_23255 [Dyadobacter sp. CY345]|uniref:hypothetical protein n=1 Tax=Dyadobacter sp. CY345 TaxID=2909335 RepID=UPI001F31D996|nr:hypothetical protein [Dyadobacter sp. CY345]MCF2446894.1 hypothetical protein [Dyadobacter sp. CY345]
MKKWVILVVLLVCQITSNAQGGADKQISEAKFQIVKETVEFLASDKETFKDVKEKQCTNCKGYKDLLQFVEKNKIKKADGLIAEWKKIKIDTSFDGWKNSIQKFKNQVVGDITSGAKSKRKNFQNYSAYVGRLESTIEKVSIAEPIEDVPDIQKIEEEPGPVVESKVTEPEKVMSEKSSESASFFAFLLDLSKDMSYTIMLLLVAGILFLLWVLRNKNQVIERNEKTLNDHLHRSGSTEFQSKNLSNELKSVKQKLKEAEAEIAILQDNVRAEMERNERLSVVPEIEKTLEQVPVLASESSIKYARYADLGDGFSVQELLDEEDSETIFEINLITPATATFKISGNQNAQRYALSNSPYFLGKTSQYDTFPSGNSLINTDIPGELKLQGNKWLIVKPIQISFS